MGEADGANHPPTIEFEPSVKEKVGEPSEIVDAPGSVYHGIFAKLAAEYSECNTFAAPETDS